MIIRPCRRNEVDAVLGLWRANPGATDDPESVAGLVDHDDEALLVAEVEAEIVGTLIAAWDGWRGNMYRLVVAPAQRRRGVATQLVEEGERLLRTRGARRITALVDRDQAVAEFWRDAGYRLDSDITRYVKSLP